MGLVTSSFHVLFPRFFDRVSKGIRTSPHDVLPFHSCNENKRGRAFGFQGAMDHARAMIGPLIVTLLLSSLTKNLELFSSFPSFLHYFV